MKTRNLRQSGWTLLEIMIVVSLIGFLAAIAIPNFIRARSTSHEKACLNNLRQIDAAAQTWAAENNKQSLDSYTLNDIQDYFQRSAIPQCPSGGQYGPSFTVGTATTCTILGHVLQYARALTSNVIRRLAKKETTLARLR
jgi:prepilin-type N-terminal cleavage/methylation domain-containing protein